MTDAQPAAPPVAPPPVVVPVDPAPIPAPPSSPLPPPEIVVPPTGEPVALSHALISLVIAIVNLVGYIQAWAPETFGLVNAVVAAAALVLGVITRQATTSMSKVKALAKAIPQLAAAFNLKD